jgi:hypothetical protein
MRGGDPEIGRGEAFALLAAYPYPEREERLGSVLRDRRESQSTRSAAAIALGRIASRDSQQVLLANLPTSEPVIQTEILHGLGRIGGPETLAAIETLRLSEDRGKESAAFAAALIAHRWGLEGHELPLPPEEHLLKIRAEKSEPVRVSPLTSEQAAKVIADLARQPYGIEYDPERLVRLECAWGRNVVCPNREFTSPGSVVRLAERKALAGVVALESPETGDYSVSYLLLVAPKGRSARILAPRCSGREALAGTGEVVDDRLEFHLRAVERPGAFPIELDGEFTGELRFRRAVISLDRVPSRTPALRR